MNKIIEYFIKYPIWANAIIIVTAIAGILSLFSMPHSFFPEMQPNRVYVAVSYPGASPEEMMHIHSGIMHKVSSRPTSSFFQNVPISARPGLLRRGETLQKTFTSFTYICSSKCMLSIKNFGLLQLSNTIFRRFSRKLMPLL